jgi:hypothetical protein
VRAIFITERAPERNAPGDLRGAMATLKPGHEIYDETVTKRDQVFAGKSSHRSCTLRTAAIGAVSIGRASTLPLAWTRYAADEYLAPK